MGNEDALRPVSFMVPPLERSADLCGDLATKRSAEVLFSLHEKEDFVSWRWPSNGLHPAHAVGAQGIEADAVLPDDEMLCQPGLVRVRTASWSGNIQTTDTMSLTLPYVLLTLPIVADISV